MYDSGQMQYDGDQGANFEDFQNQNQGFGNGNGGFSFKNGNGADGFQSFKFSGNEGDPN